MARWDPWVALGLALLVAAPVAGIFAHSLLAVAPAAGRAMPGGTIEVDVTMDRQDWTDASAVCLTVRIEPLPDDGSSPPGTWHWVCPRTVAHAILLAPRAAGTLLIEWNGTEHRIPFLVPKGTHAFTWAAVDPDGLEVGSAPTAVGGSKGGAWVWVGAAQAAAFLGFLGLLAARGRLAWMCALLGAAFLLWIPLRAAGPTHVPLWILLLGWAALAAAAFSRPGGKPREPAPPHGEPLDAPAAP